MSYLLAAVFALYAAFHGAKFWEFHQFARMPENPDVSDGLRGIGRRFAALHLNCAVLCSGLMLIALAN